MSKYNDFEMCQKFFGQQYKYDKQNQKYIPYSRTDMWEKLLEYEQLLHDERVKSSTAYNEGLLQKQFDKDKISFAVEQFEKVKEFLYKNDLIKDYQSCAGKYFFEQYIDNQINQLKEKKNK